MFKDLIKIKRYFLFHYNDLFIIKLCFQQIVKEYMHAWNRIDRTSDH